MLNPRWRSYRVAMIVCLVLLSSCSGTSAGDSPTEEAGSVAGEAAIADEARAAVCEHIDEWSDGLEAIVFLDVAASESDIAEVAARLEQVGGIDFTFVDKDAALAELRDMFRNPDQILSDVDEIPTSFRIRLLTDDATEAVAALFVELREHPSVQQVITTAGALAGWPEC